MTDMLTNFSPQATLIVAVSWLIREVLGFIYKIMQAFIDKMEPKNGTKQREMIVFDSMLKAIERNNELTQQLLTKISLNTQKLDMITKNQVQ